MCVCSRLMTAHDDRGFLMVSLTVMQAAKRWSGSIVWSVMSCGWRPYELEMMVDGSREIEFARCPSSLIVGFEANISVRVHICHPHHSKPDVVWSDWQADEEPLEWGEREGESPRFGSLPLADADGHQAGYCDRHIHGNLLARYVL